MVMVIMMMLVMMMVVMMVVMMMMMRRRSLEPPSDVLWGIRWDAFRSEVELYCLLQQTD